MPVVVFVEPDGARRTVETRVGASLMEAALRRSIAGIEAKCRGNCACVTCHVLIDEAFAAAAGPPGAMEESMLDFADGAERRSRLACQVRISQDCEGMLVYVPEAQRTLGL